MGNSACFQGVQGPVPRTPKHGFKVCVCGGAGNIGQSLCLLLVLDPRVKELSVFDLSIAMLPAEGIGKDLDHIERRCRVKAYSLGTSDKPVDHLQECLTGCDLVLVLAGVPNKGRTPSDLLKINVSITKTIVEACGKFCPEAVVGLIVNPLNSVLPAMSRLYEKKGLDPMKICGVTCLDSVRANKFVHEDTQKPIETIDVPVVGGFSGNMSGTTALPLFSQDSVASRIPESRRKELVKKVQAAGEDVQNAKKGKGGGPLLSMAYAGARFSKAVLAGLSGQRTVETVFVKSSVCHSLDYFSSKVTFGRSGVEKVHPLGEMDAHEQEQLQQVVNDLGKEIQEGLVYAEGAELSFGQGDKSLGKILPHAATMT